ncbi:MAG TPA: hypothetical protein PLD59_06195 [Tepidisphaeraceae bacterium]|nr:hypothetical protein [Tepidisphaeraceae bacterium]
MSTARPIERTVGVAEVLRHRQRVVQVGQRLRRKLRPGVEHPLRRGPDGLLLRVGGVGGPRVVVVDELAGIPVTRLQPPTHLPHPRHVHRAAEYAEVVAGDGGDQERKI